MLLFHQSDQTADSSRLCNYSPAVQMSPVSTAEPLPFQRQNNGAHFRGLFSTLTFMCSRLFWVHPSSETQTWITGLRTAMMVVMMTTVTAV